MLAPRLKNQLFVNFQLYVPETVELFLQCISRGKFFLKINLSIPNCLGVVEFQRFFEDYQYLGNQLTDNAVCRTAPTLLGLFNLGQIQANKVNWF